MLKTHQKSKTKEFQKVQASPEKTQVQFQILTVLSNTTIIPHVENLGEPLMIEIKLPTHESVSRI